MFKQLITADCIATLTFGVKKYGVKHSVKSNHNRTKILFVQSPARGKLITLLLRGRIIFCCHVNRFLTVSLLYEIFTLQNSNSQGENCPKNAIFGPNKCHSE